MIFDHRIIVAQYWTLGMRFMNKIRLFIRKIATYRIDSKRKFKELNIMLLYDNFTVSRWSNVENADSF